MKLILGDCLEVMKTLPAGSVDTVVTDPPYGIGAANVKSGGRQDGASIAPSREYGRLTWDDEKPSVETFKQIFRVSTSQVIFGGEHLSHLLPQSRGWIFWDKGTGANQYADGELIWTSSDRALRKFYWQWKGMFQEDMKNKDFRYHPTQKPEALMCWILRNYTRSGDIVLDPFMGSGTTGVACVQTGRDFIGIEIDPGYFAIAENRIKEAQAQLALPLETPCP